METTKRAMTALCAAAALLHGCDQLPGSPPGQPGEIEDVSQAIQNGSSTSGDPVAGTVVKVSSLGMGCTGVLLTNRWVMTAAHCAGAVAPTPDGIGVQLGNQQRVGDQAFVHPSRDLMMIRLAQPFTVGSSTSGFSRPLWAGTSAALVGKNVTCYGFGGSGSLTKGTLPVVQTVGGGYAVGVANNQSLTQGDSGGPCFLTAAGKTMLTGITSAASPGANGTQNGVDDSRSWILETLYTGPGLMGAPAGSTTTANAPAAVTYPDGTYFLGTIANGKPYLNHGGPSGLSGFFVTREDLPSVGVVPSSLTMASTGQGNIEMFVLGNDKFIYQASLNNGAWSPWVQRVGLCNSAATAVRVSSTRIDLYCLGNTGNYFQMRLDKGTSGWAFTPPLVQIAPPSVGVGTQPPAAAVFDSAGSVVLLVRGNDGNVWRTFNNGTWAPWSNFGGAGKFAPAISGSGSAGHLDVFSVTSDGGLQQRVFDGDTWTAWFPVPRRASILSCNERPAAFSVISGRTDVACRMTVSTGTFDNHYYRQTLRD